jgi:hypothetical protein
MNPFHFCSVEIWKKFIATWSGKVAMLTSASSVRSVDITQLGTASEHTANREPTKVEYQVLEYLTDKVLGRVVRLRPLPWLPPLKSLVFHAARTIC